MNRLIMLSLLLIGSLAAPLQAQTFPFAGRLDDLDGPADGLFTFEIAVVDDADVTLWTETQTNVIVADGVFAVDVGAATPLPSTLPVRARLALTIDDDALPPVPLARLLDAGRAQRTATATTATRADRLNGVSSTEVATREALGAGGGPAVAFGNVTGVPQSVLDGDDGVDVTSTSADLAISARTLNVATVNGSRLRAGVVTGAMLPSSSVSTGLVADGAITSAKIADAALPKSRFPGPLTDREVKTTKVYINDEGCEAPGELSASAFCTRRRCTQSGGAPGFRRCSDDAICDPPPQFQPIPNCFSAIDDSIGELVLE